MIESDGKGYYAYLPAVFIYNDLHFEFFEQIEKQTYYNEHHYYDYRYAPGGHVINKYYAGTALAMAPFFGIAHLLTVFSDYPADGYSTFYPKLINLAAIFYLFISLVFLSRLLKLYQVRNGFVTLILFAIVFGTNVFYYTVVEFSMSHIYSFAFVTIFLYCIKRYFLSGTSKFMVLSGLLLGIITLIRPVNILIILAVPFLAGNWPNLIDGMKQMFRKWPSLFLSILLFLIVFSIQLIIYKLQTGNFWVYSYGEERFYWGQPKIFAILFSYRKGLFLYTPLLLVSLVGFYFLWLKSKFSTLSLFSFLAFITYVLSSWWMWYYGGSFSSRVYIEYFALFAVLLGLALEGFYHRLIRSSYIALIVLLSVICQIQTYQYRYYHIHWSDMNKEKYWEKFMRIDLLIKSKNQ
jgi:hypothetical protein